MRPHQRFLSKTDERIFFEIKKNICRHTKDCFAKMDREETKTSEMKFVKGIMRSGPTGWLFLNYTPPSKKGGREPKKHPVILENIIFISQRVYYHLYLHWLASLSFGGSEKIKLNFCQMYKYIYFCNQINGLNFLRKTKVSIFVGNGGHRINLGNIQSGRNWCKLSASVIDTL